MARYRASCDWTLAEPGEDFLKGRYARAHTVGFGSGVEVPGTASASGAHSKLERYVGRSQKRVPSTRLKPICAWIRRIRTSSVQIPE